jgi:signal transduction histidine kinase
MLFQHHPFALRIFSWIVAIALICGYSAENPAFAQSYSIEAERGAYPVLSFSPRDYRGHAQNWVISQTDDGLIYVGNGTSLLEYDGVQWRTIPVRGNAAVRSLAAGSDGTLYIGTASDLGYLGADSLGRPVYRSLLDEHRDERPSISDVWAIVPVGSDLYFSTRERLFRLEADTLREWIPDRFFALGFEYNGMFHTVTPEHGLVRMEGDSLVPAPGGESFKEDIAFFAIQRPDGRIIIGSRDRGLLLYDGARLSPFAEEINPRLIADYMYGGTGLHDGRLALSTRVGGMYLLDPDGNLIRHFSRRDGIPDDHVWNVFEDSQRGLWLALNSGIARIELNSSITHFGEDVGLPGLVIDVERHHGVIHAATSTGVFRMNPDANRMPGFEPLLGETAGQCLDLLSTEHGLLAGCELGLYVFENGRQRRLTEASTRLFYRLPSHPEVILASARSETFVLRQTRGRWQIDSTLDGVPPWAISMNEAHNSLWLTTVSEGAVRIVLNDDIQVDALESFSTGAGLPEGWSYTTDIDGSARFFTQSGVFLFDESSSSFRPDPDLTSTLPHPDADVFLLRQGTDGTVWFLNEDDLGYATPSGDVRIVSDFPDTRPTSLMIDEAGGTTWIATLDGLFRYHPEGVRQEAAPIAARIRSLHTTHGDSLIAAGEHLAGDRVKLAAGTDGLRFSYALPAFGQPDRNEYKVKLDGIDRDWASWSSETSTSYSNLTPGTYSFHVRARDVHGVEAEPAILTFTIKPYWYQTWWSKLIAVLTGLASLIWLANLALRARTRRLHARNVLLEREVRDRTRTLELANRQLRRVVDQNNEFLNIAAHDLKNPLVGILGFSEILLSTDVSEEERKEFLTLIRDSAISINRAIEDFQTTDIIDNQKIELNVQRADLVPIVRSVIARNAPQAERKSIEVTLEAPSAVESMIDAQYLPRVIDNLLSNAIKFSEIGRRVWIDVRRRGAEAAIFVRDEGPGLTESDMARVFGKRERLSARPTHGEDSSGLGLYIVRTLVEAHGGSVSVDSKRGQGATFIVRLPLAEDFGLSDGSNLEAELARPA